MRYRLRVYEAAPFKFTVYVVCTILPLVSLALSFFHFLNMVIYGAIKLFTGVTEKFK